MKRDDFLKEFSEVLQRQPSAVLTGDEQLQTLPDWDSLAVVMLIAHIDKTYGAVLSVEQIGNAETVNDLYACALNEIEAKATSGSVSR